MDVHTQAEPCWRAGPVSARRDRPTKQTNERATPKRASEGGRGKPVSLRPKRRKAKPFSCFHNARQRFRWSPGAWRRHQRGGWRAGWIGQRPGRCASRAVPPAPARPQQHSSPHSEDAARLSAGARDSAFIPEQRTDVTRRGVRRTERAPGSFDCSPLGRLRSAAASFRLCCWRWTQRAVGLAERLARRGEQRVCVE